MAAFITSPTIVRVKDRNGTLIVPVARTFIFTGSVQVIQTNPSEATINVMGAEAINGGDIIYGNVTSVVIGLADGAGSVLESTGRGSIAAGYAHGGFEIRALGDGSLSMGATNLAGIATQRDGSIAFGDDLDGASEYSQTFGLGHNNLSYLGAMFGRWGEDAPNNPTTWVSTDPLFVIGIGSAEISKRNGWQVDKDGRIKTVAAHVDTATRTVNASGAVSARTDRSLYCASNLAAIALTLPAGEDGLEFFINDVGNNALTNNITFVTSGGDTIQAGADITTDGGYCHLQFFNGSWRILSHAEVVANSETSIVEYITLDATDIANQFITLSQTPLAGTLMFFAGKLAQFDGDDFSVTGAQLDFLGDLATGGPAALVNGDKVIASYSY